MIKYQNLVFNDFQVNTYVLWDETKECIIIDAACYYEDEKTNLKKFISQNELKPVKLVNTHNHLDHILGNPFVKRQYNIPLYAHEEGQLFLRMAEGSASFFGVEVNETVNPDYSLKDGETLSFGASELKVIYTPGHADGSICLLAENENLLFAGDVLFREGIGRTDLPTGDYSLLEKNIKEKLFTLGDEVRVMPGHGPETSIGYEKSNNPFITD